MEGNCALPPSFPVAKLLLLGEIHGTAESPALVRKVVCAISEKESVGLGLEIPRSEQPLIDAYLSSAGRATDKALLLASSFWANDRDGRSSEAMFGLIEAVRYLKQQRRDIHVFLFDWQPDTHLERNIAIATGIRAYVLAHPQRTVVTLMGNIHAMKKDRGAGSDTIVPSGKLLLNLNPISVELASPSGTAWVCMPECRAHIFPKGKTDALPIGIGPGRFGGYDFAYRLPTATASKPAGSGG
jgi:hypothetical protein